LWFARRAYGALGALILTAACADEPGAVPGEAAVPAVSFEIEAEPALSVGVQAAVFGVGNDKLNIRNRPSLSDSQVLFRENEGKRFDIIGGPQAADGYTWWQVRDPQFQVTGWAVANYLRTISEDAG